MTKLNIPIPPFILHRRLVIEKTCDLRSKLLTRIRLYGLDFDGIPFEFIKRVEMKDTSGVQLKEQEGEPYNLVCLLSYCTQNRYNTHHLNTGGR